MADVFTAQAPLSAPPAAPVRERALDATALAFLHVDRAGLIQDWNPAAERLFGWNRAEVLGRALADTIVPASLRSAHNAGFARRLVTGEGDTLGHRVEVPAIHRNGRELRVSMIIDACGDDGFTAFVSDQTQWYEAQQELQRSSTLISAILQHTTAVISAKDLDGRYLFVNGEYERVYQVTAADMVGRSEAEMLAASVAAVGRAHDVQVTATGTARTVLEEIPFGDDIRQYVVTRVPLTDPDGSVYGVCTIAIDDTSRRRDADALAAGEQRFWNTINNAPGMLYQYRMEPDGTTSFTFVSEGCRDIFQLEPYQVIEDANLVLGTIAPEDQEGFVASVMLSQQTLEPWDWRGSTIRKDGSRRWLYGVSRPHREPGGATVWDGMLLDRTRERDTELDLAAVRGDLENLVDRLASVSFTALAGPDGAVAVPAADGTTGPCPVAALEALIVPAERASLAELWSAALRGERVDTARTGPDGPVHIRMRNRQDGAGRTGGRTLIGVACFDLGRAR
ncbi:PAS domain S-box protein [Actinoplanes sp. GCM10030250]|uniref:PAS domain-containing protein n=1 Tax=Actinoplanes sp. GCM10030250 TaxID=3273376 RepID=UPI003619903E